MPPRLLIVSFSVCPAPDRHGVGLLNVLKALAGRYAVDVLTLRPAQPGSVELPVVERFMKTRMLRVPVGHGTLGEKLEVFRRAIRRQLEGEEYDVVHVRSAWGARAVLAGVQPPTKVVYEIARSTEGEPRAADAQLAAALAEEESELVARADLVLVPTETARRHLVEARQKSQRQPKPTGSILTLPPGVDVDHFDWEPIAEEDAAGRVLYGGRIGAGRGVRLLLSAIELLRRQRPVKLVLAGPVEEGFRPILDEALAQTGLAPDVELCGAIDHDDMPRVIAGAEVCVAPASPDAADRPLAGFPTKILEYMACRRAVVAPRRPSVMEVLSDGAEGLLFEPGAPAELARAIGRLLDDAPLRERLAEAGYHRVRLEHPASATRRALLEAYLALLPRAAWAPPGRASPTIDALPSHPDTTTARRAVPWLDPAGDPDGRARGERSGEIVIPEAATVEIPVIPGEIVIEALDFASAGEAFDAQMDDTTTSPLLLPPPPDSDDDDERTSPALRPHRPSR
ncbi:MAG TPA: glycosyltransferase family 4 protein [Polyangia bacterium]